MKCVKTSHTFIAEVGQSAFKLIQVAEWLISIEADTCHGTDEICWKHMPLQQNKLLFQSS